jgi:hypothetical protein
MSLETDMTPLTYQNFLENPELRTRIERSAHQARAKAIREFIAIDFAALFRPLLQAASLKATASLRVLV